MRFALVVFLISTYSFYFFGLPKTIGPIHKKPVFLQVSGPWEQSEIYSASLHIWLVQYLADLKFEKNLTHRSTIGSIIEQSLLRDPLGQLVFFLSCFKALDILEWPQLCQKITDISFQLHPGAWETLFLRGWVEAKYFPESGKAQYFFSLAAQKNGSPAFIEGLAQSLEGKRFPFLNTIKRGQ